MAFDAENHVIDSKTGFMLDKNSGHRVGIDPAPHKGPEVVDPNWPKWVKLHESQIERREGGPPFSKHWDGKKTAYNRVTGELAVLVENEDEEKQASEDVLIERAPEPVLDPIASEEHHEE